MKTSEKLLLAVTWGVTSGLAYNFGRTANIHEAYQDAYYDGYEQGVKKHVSPVEISRAERRGFEECRRMLRAEGCEHVGVATEQLPQAGGE